MYMHERSLKRALGLSEREVRRMGPETVVYPTQIDGVTVYVKARHTGTNPEKRHRVRAICPECGKDTSAGRMFQHRAAKHGVKPQYRYIAAGVDE